MSETAQKSFTRTNIIDEIISVLKKAEHIYIIGNGGSAAVADHLACDLLKNCQLPAISLCSNQAICTAIANDESFDKIFLIQLMALFKERDVLMAFSTRGTSPNIVNAAKYAAKIGKVLGIAGFNGGVLKNYSGIFYDLGSLNMQECEDRMSIFCHDLHNKLPHILSYGKE